MSALDPGARDDSAPAPERQSPREQPKRGHSHWLMIACCVPMLVIAIVLVATGVVGAGLIVAAVACAVMMGAMMLMMGGMGGGRG